MSVVMQFGAAVPARQKGLPAGSSEHEINVADWGRFQVELTESAAVCLSSAAHPQPAESASASVAAIPLSANHSHACLTVGSHSSRGYTMLSSGLLSSYVDGPGS